MKKFDTGYAVGLIVGEGCFSGYLQNGKTPCPALAVRIHPNDPLPLKHLRNFSGKDLRPLSSQRPALLGLAAAWPGFTRRPAGPSTIPSCVPETGAVEGMG